MRLRAAKPRVRDRRDSAGKRSRPDDAPATFAWTGQDAKSRPIVVEREVVVERAVEKPVFVDRPVEVERLVEVEKLVEVERLVEVEKPVFVDRPVEKIVEKIVDRPVTVEIEKIVEKQVTVEIEKIVEVEKVVEKPVLVEVDSGGEKSAKTPKTIVIGRGPGLMDKLSRALPKPAPLIAGVASLLLAIFAMSLISPSGDNAVADRGKVRSPDQKSEENLPDLSLSNESLAIKRSSRDPFAAEGHEEKLSAAEARAKAAAKRKAAAATRAAAPAAAAPNFTANLTVYSSYTPWKRARKRAGGWVDFADKPTIKVLSVGANTLLLFAVTDVEVDADKSRKISYDKPIRQIKLQRGGIVRFADYRDIQGEDVTYTVRFDDAEKIRPRR